MPLDPAKQPVLKSVGEVNASESAAYLLLRLKANDTNKVEIGGAGQNRVTRVEDGTHSTSAVPVARSRLLAHLRKVI